jgi:dGTPase
LATKVKGLAPGESPTLETQVVDIADEIAYDNHDLDDGLTSGLIHESDLQALDIWHSINNNISAKFRDISPEKRKYLIIRSLIDLQVTDLIKETEKNILKFKLKSCKDVKKIDKKIVTFSKDMLKLRIPLRAFLMERLYHHYRVMRMSIKAKRFIKELFCVYEQNPNQLPAEIQGRVERDGVKRAVCDYIAGMTDRYALDEYKKLFNPYEKV